MHRLRLTPFRAGVLTGLYFALWLALAFVVPGDTTVERIGWGGAYLLGLCWTVYLVERAARRIEARRGPVEVSGLPLIPVGGEVRNRRAGRWNPLDPAARLYGRTSQRLRQSLAMLGAYSLVFLLVYVLAHLKFGTASDELEADLPAGGGKESVQASSVRVQKVVRKKYVINPYSSILFAAPPPIDQVDLKLNAETANQYKAGQGPGGLGSGEGEGGGFGGSGNGRWEIVRLRHSDKAWDKNFGIGGDRNLLAEVRTVEPRAKIPDEDQSVDYATLARYSVKKPLVLLYVGGTHTFAPTAAEKKILREYLIEKHGMILGDNLGGQGFHGQFVAAITEVTGVNPVPIPRDDRIHQSPFQLPQLPIVTANGGTVPLGWKIDGRWAVYYHPGALSDGWRDDHAGIKREIWQLCYQLGINILSYANTEQMKWRQSRQP